MKYLVAGLVQLAGVAWIIKSAIEPDGYYGDGTTRWEHASHAGSTLVVVGGSIVAAVIALVFLLAGVRRCRLDPALAVVGTAIYLVAWVVSWVALVGGH